MISLFRKTAFAATFIFVSASAAVGQSDLKQVEITLPQARELAVQALRSNQPGDAIKLANGLLLANPKDPFAHFVLASAYANSKKYVEGRKAAGRAFRYSKSSPDKFRSAELAARVSFAAEQYSLAQFWLRRAAIHTASEADEKKLAQDYKVLRRINPWTFSLRTGIRPSSNVNNGADSAANVIDGTPDGGAIPAGAVALSGLIGTVDLQLGYRLKQTQTSLTSLSGRLYVQRVSLSSTAKADAPNATGSDYASTYGEVSLRHAFAVGPAEKKGAAAVQVTLGESWYQDQRNYQFARLTGERNWQLGENGRLQINALGEQRFRSRYLANDARLYGLGTSYTHKLTNQDSFKLSLTVRDATSLDVNGTYSSAALSADYAFGRALGPAKLSAGLSLGYTKYDAFKFSLPAPPVLPSRTDKSAYATVTAFFEEYDYAGFAPALHLRVGRKKSNFSAFSSREVSLSVGVGSKF